MPLTGEKSEHCKKNKAPLSKATVIILSVFSLGLMLTAGDYNNKQKVIVWDVVCYYNYLPAAFKYHSFDFSHLPMRVGYKTSAEGKVSQKMTMGLSFLYLPFYLIAWLYTGIAGLPNDEYSSPFSLLLNISAIFYMLAGLYFIRKTLLLYFSDLIATLGLATIFLGTNALYYTAFDGPMSHAYTFCLISLFVWLTIKWHIKPLMLTSILLGLTAGLIILIRPSNITILIFALLWNTHNRNYLKEKLKLIRTNLPKVIILSFCLLLVWVPQMIYWHYATGKWLYFSYAEEGFFFTSPNIHLGLLSYRNGWLIYAPVMLFSILGIFFLRKQLKAFFTPVLLYFLVSIFIIFSWWCWWYVGFGLRAMIDLYPVLAIPLCAILSQILKVKIFLKVPLMIIWGLLVILGLFKNYQYKKSAIHFDSMTSKAYWTFFFSTEITSGDYYLMLKSPDYDAALKGKQKTIQ